MKIEEWGKPEKACGWQKRERDEGKCEFGNDPANQLMNKKEIKKKK